MQLLNWISRSTRIFKTSAILGIAGLSLSSLNALPSDLDSYIAKGMAEWNLPGLGLAVVKDGKVLVSKGYGERRAGSGEPIDGQTLFAIGSTTKAFTCTAIGTLVDEKKVRWDTPVHEIYPAVRFSDPWINREIRVSDLMANHSGLSGVSEHLWYGTDLTRQDILSRLVHVPFEASFRYTFQYRNVAFLFAGELIPQLSGESWERAIENRIFRPLGMNRSYATQVGVEALHNVAQPHIANYDGKPLAISYRNMVNIAPAGSILSCPDDMAKWMIMNLSNGSYGGQQVLQPGTLAFIHRPHTPLNTVGPAGQELSPPAELRGYALGWIAESYRGVRLVWHNGGIDGMSTWVGLAPELGIGVAVTSNLDECDFRKAIFYKIIDHYAGNDFVDLQPDLLEIHHGAIGRRVAAEEEWQKLGREAKKAALPLEAYARNYWSDLLGSVSMRVKDGVLVFHRTPEMVIELRPQGGNTFMGKFRSESEDLRSGKIKIEFMVSGSHASSFTEDDMLEFSAR